MGGAENFFLRLLHGLNERQQSVCTITRPGSQVSKLIDADIPQYFASMKNQMDYLSKWKISKIIRQQKPDVVQTYMTRATMQTKIQPGKGVVHIARLGGYYKIKRFAHAHAWVGNTRGICDYLIRGGLPARRVFYIGNFVDQILKLDESEKSELRMSMGIPDDAWVITAAGRFAAKKGFDVLLSAFDMLPESISGRPVHLIIVGDGAEKDALLKQAATSKKTSRIHWPGWQSDPGPWFELADVYVCPSREEPLGNVILEGWAHCLPVISTATMGGVELIKDGENGLLTPVDDVDSISRSIMNVIKDDELRNSLAQSGNQEIQVSYNKEVIVQSYIDLYDSLKNQ